MNKIKILCALSLILAVSACSSSGGGGSSKSNNGGASVVPSHVPAVLSKAPGASFDPDDGTPDVDGNRVQASSLIGVRRPAFAELQMAIDDGLITAPSALPSTGSATLKGYVRFGGRAEDEIMVGHLTIAATFGAGMSATVETTATGFSEFYLANPDNPAPVEGVTGGALAGSGMIDGTTITSTLNGDLFHGGQTATVVADFVDGRVYDNGEGTLVVHGTVAGRATFPAGSFIPNYNTNGEFAASGASPSE